MKRLVRSILLQRQRALRVAILAFAAGTLLYLGHPGQIGALPVPVLAGLLYAAFVTPAAVLTVAFLPGLTALSDAMQWSRLIFASFVAAFPEVLRPIADAPLASATIIILIGSGLVAAQRQRQRWMPVLAAV